MKQMGYVLTDCNSCADKYIQWKAISVDDF